MDGDVTKPQRASESSDIPPTCKEFAKSFPVLRPVLRLMGIDVSSPETAYHALRNLPAMAAQTALDPEAFNAHFAQRGWILFDHTGSDVVQDARRLVDEGKFEEAEQILVGHLDEKTIGRHLERVSRIGAFRRSMPELVDTYLAYRKGDHKATVPVLVKIMDEVVQRVWVETSEGDWGLAPESARSQAWSLFARDSKGLRAFKTILVGEEEAGGPRDGRRQPFPGVALERLNAGYVERLASAKAWTGLFAVAEWARKMENGGP